MRSSPKLFLVSLMAATAIGSAAFAQTATQDTSMPAGQTMATPTPTPTATPKMKKGKNKAATSATQSSDAMPAAQPMPATPGQPAAMPAAPGQAAATAPNPTVGGAAMDATKPIPVNASAAPNLTTLVTAVKAAGLVDTLAGPGPFTVFAPTNDAFSRLAPGTVDTLMKPESKATLAKVLTYHVVPGALTLDQIKAQITAGGGTATMKTVEGENLTFKMPSAGAIEIDDVHGNKSYIQTPDVRQSNGVVHVVNGVLLPTVNG